jgi:hypothetical protein
MAPLEPNLYSSKRKKRAQLRRSEIWLGTTFYGAPNGAFRFNVTPGYKDFAPPELLSATLNLAENIFSFSTAC